MPEGLDVAGGVLVAGGTCGVAGWAAAACCCAARSTMLCGAAGLRCDKYAIASARIKNSVARTAVTRLRKFAEPPAPKTVPEAPLPKAAPASAPLPCCSRMNMTSVTATNTRMISRIVYSMEPLKMLVGIRPPLCRWPEIHLPPGRHRPPSRHRYRASGTVRRHSKPSRCHRKGAGYRQLF